MPFTKEDIKGQCTVCGSEANLRSTAFNVGEIVDCARCGDFRISHVTADDFGLPFSDPKRRALASYTIRKMQISDRRPELTRAFFESLETRSLPTPSEASDNLIVLIGEKSGGRPGMANEVFYADPVLLGTVGVVEPEDLEWIVESLHSRKLIDGLRVRGKEAKVRLTVSGWEKFEELKRAHVASRFAFFARKFENPELDKVFNSCLKPAVAETGFTLQTVTQKAGLVDAVIEDEIRRCRFLIADLSDDNAGAYWEAGFAEGLGKPVIYICNAKKADPVHFDANHRHMIKWDLDSLPQTATKLKAVIRNTLLGEAKQGD